MAALFKADNSWLVQVQVDNRRRTIRIGAIAERDARPVRSHIEQLANAAVLKLPVPLETARWLANVGDTLHKRLAAAGLVPARGAAAEPATLARYFDGYIARRSDLNPRTRSNFAQCRASVVKYFGAGRAMATITPAEAKDWQRYEAGKRAKATVAGYVKKARQVYADAVARKILTD